MVKQREISWFFLPAIVILACPDFSYTAVIGEKYSANSQQQNSTHETVSSKDAKESSNLGNFVTSHLQAEGTAESNQGWTTAPVDYGWASYYGDPNPYHYYSAEAPFSDGFPVIEMGPGYSYNSGPPPRKRRPKRPPNLLKSLQKSFAMQASKRFKSLQNVIKTITSPEEPSTTTAAPESTTTATPTNEMAENSPVVDILAQLAPTLNKLVGGVGNALAGEGSLLALKRDAVLARWKFRKALIFGVPETIIKAKFNLPNTLVNGKKTLLKVASALKPQRPPPPNMISMIMMVPAENGSNPSTPTPMAETVSETPQYGVPEEEGGKLNGLYPPMAGAPDSWSNYQMPWMIPTLPSYYDVTVEQGDPKGPEVNAKWPKREATNTPDSEKEKQVPKQSEETQATNKEEQEQKPAADQVSVTKANAEDAQTSGSHNHGKGVPLMFQYPNVAVQGPMLMPVPMAYPPHYRPSARRASQFQWGPFSIPRPRQFIF